MSQRCGSADMDIGRERDPPPPPPPPPPHPERKGEEKKERNAAPSMLEIQQMQGRDASRRDEWIQSQRQAPRPPRPHHHEPPDTPVGLTGGMESTGRYAASNGHDPPFGFAPPLPAPTPVTSAPVNPNSNSTTPTNSQSALYLPPRARSPSTPPIPQPGTPTRPGYPLSGHTQTNLVTSTGPYVVNVGELETQGTPRRGRERGYSSASASGRGSDLESSSHGHMTSPVPPFNGKLHKQSQPPHAVRSPLVNSYGNQTEPHPALPEHPHYSVESAPPPLPNPFPPTEAQGMKLHNGPDRRESDVDTPKALDKDKKKFWGMGWGERNKGREIATTDGSMPGDRRADLDRSRENQASAIGSHGHGEEEPRGRLLGLDFGRQAAPVDGVVYAISESPSNVID